MKKRCLDGIYTPEWCEKIPVVSINGGDYCEEHGMQRASILRSKKLPVTKTDLKTGETVKEGPDDSQSQG